MVSIIKMLRERKNIFSEKNIKEGNLFFMDQNSLELIIDNWGAGMRTIKRDGRTDNIRGYIYDIYSNRDMDRVQDRKTVSVYRNSQKPDTIITPSNSEYENYKSQLEEAGRW